MTAFADSSVPAQGLTFFEVLPRKFLSLIYFLVTLFWLLTKEHFYSDILSHSIGQNTSSNY